LRLLLVRLHQELWYHTISKVLMLLAEVLLKLQQNLLAQGQLRALGCQVRNLRGHLQELGHLLSGSPALCLQRELGLQVELVRWMEPRSLRTYQSLSLVVRLDQQTTASRTLKAMALK